MSYFDPVDSIVDENNSTTAVLSAGAEFVGQATDITEYSSIMVSTYSDQGSATDGLKIEQSSDGANWDHCDEFTISATTGKNFTINPFARYMRVRYLNGPVNQTEFRLQVVLKATQATPSAHRIQDSISDDDDARLVKAVLTGENGGGSFKNVKVTQDGNLSISDNSSGLSISKGDVSGVSFVHKFGNAPDFDTIDGEITIWDAAEDGAAWEQMVYNYSTTADIDRVSSSSASDTNTITIIGQDAAGTELTQTVTLTGQTPVAIPIPLERIYRAFNPNGTLFVGHVFIFVNVTTTAGVPDTTANIRAVIDPENQQTEMAIYTIPAGKTGYMRSWYAATSGSNKNSNYRIRLLSRNAGGVFRVQHISAISDVGTSSYIHKYDEPKRFEAGTDIEMRVKMLAAGATGASFSAGFDIVLVDN